MQISDEMVELACAAITEKRGFQWPSSFDDEEQQIGRENMRAALEAALSAQDTGAIAGVRVKPLQWHKSHMPSWNDDWHTTTPFIYTVRCADENGWKWSAHGASGYASSHESAKAAAQADYSARVLSALEPQERPQHGGAVNRMLLDQILQNAFFAGRGTSGLVSQEDMAAWQDYDPTKLEAYKRLRSALEAASAQERDGWKLVPQQATPEMEDAAIKKVKPYHDLESWSRHMPGDLFRLAWPVMLAAAPPHTEGKLMVERIVSAAIYLGGIISLPRPARHGDIIATMDTIMDIEGHLATPDRQGFLTDAGRYVNRVEGYGIAWKAGQIISDTRGPQLYSEDLW